MSRLPRIVLPGCPHHVIQRGVRSMRLFHSDSDRRYYIELLAELSSQHGLSFWAWCLMTNHVHFIAVPESEESLARAIGETHRRFTLHINRREEVRGHLFQERFHSFPVQGDGHLLTVIRYIENNPVRAKMVKNAEDYEWSSARHHVQEAEDPLVTNSPVRELEPRWNQFLAADKPMELESIRHHVKTGRPLGNMNWCRRWGKRLSRDLIAKSVGRPKKSGE